jgi:hypothetical protein
LLRAGVRPKVVFERLEHSSVGITMHVYLHVLRRMPEEAARRDPRRPPMNCYQAVNRRDRDRAVTLTKIWWARSQRIRTAAESSFQLDLFRTAAESTYQRIAVRARHLKQLGITDAVIARHLGVSDKTATKAIAWITKRDG